MDNKPDMHEACDEELLEAALRARGVGERELAVTQLLTRHQRRVYGWCYRILRDRERALELSQDVLVSAWRHLDTFDRRSRFSSWLYALARNHCLSELRRASPAFTRGFDLERLCDGHGDPERRLLEQMGEEEVLGLIRGRLDALEQEALWLRCVEGLSVEAITMLLDVQESSGARAVLQRARRKLRTALDHRDWPEAAART
jgi:RNA polymerase sigma-70 factor (ECF subfamily)